MNNKLIKVFSLLAVVLLMGSCDEDPYVSYGSGETQKIGDPYLQILSPVVSFQAGTPEYNLNFDIINGERALSKVNVYSSFTDAATGEVSDPILFKSYDVNGENKIEVRDIITYGDLQSGITIGGSPLPDDQTLLPVGSGWKLTFDAESAQGPLDLGGAVNVAVLSRFAGLYRVIESDYYRINVQSGIADWTGQERFIGSVDATTFSYNDFWGPFGWGGASFNFVLNEADNTITVPVVTGSGLFSGTRALSCDTEPEMFVDVPCEGSNVLEPEETEGKHIIKITYGYFTDGSGSRQFYEVLEKI